MSCSQHPCNCQKLRFLVRLSDALSQAAVDCTQDWFFLDLPIFASAPTETVGDLLLFAAELETTDCERATWLSAEAFPIRDCGNVRHPYLLFGITCTSPR